MHADTPEHMLRYPVRNAAGDMKRGARAARLRRAQCRLSREGSGRTRRRAGDEGDVQELNRGNTFDSLVCGLKSQAGSRNDSTRGAGSVFTAFMRARISTLCQSAVTRRETDRFAD